ncbi:MAG: hypothetical protein BWK76_09605 [Desulfobulbaceae bacterium A2]|nr:MAG: hypothetical protein BWK76_09605 [Desulfobulbaceae bacterium A2]
MAEIRSTMDLVMERAARIGSASSDELQNEERRRLGMQRAAAYLDGKLEDLGAELAGVDQAQQPAVRRGMIEALLRNIMLAREEGQQHKAEQALQALSQLGGGAGDLKSIGKELLHIVGQYAKHREQLRRQLEDAIKVQMEQMLARQPGLGSSKLKLDPTLQPKFKEEWSRIETELGDQYGRALEQHKDQLRQRLLGAR